MQAFDDAYHKNIKHFNLDEELLNEASSKIFILSLWDYDIFEFRTTFVTCNNENKVTHWP